MTQNLPPETTSGNIFSRYPFLTRSVSLIGSLSLLGSGISLAQTNQVVDSIGMPATPAPTPAPAPRVTPPPAPKAAPAAPAPAPRRVAPPPAPRPAPAPRVAPAPRRVAPPPVSVSKPIKANPPAPTLSAPRVSVPSPTRVESSQGVTRLLPQPETSSPRATVTAPRKTVSNNYVDPTGYTGGGNSGGYQKPTQVVITERRTNNGTNTQSVQKRQPTQARTVAVPAPRQSSGRVTRQRVPVVAAQPTRPTRQATVSPSPAPQPKTVAARAISPQQLAYNALNKLSQKYADNGKTDLLFPLSIPARISSSFGWRVHPIAKTMRLHSGTDIPAPLGTPVLSAYEGEVEVADYVKGYGNMVILRHLDGTQESRYAHLSEIFVKPGEWVKQGVVIGSVGSTGYSTGPHLHFEWRHLMESGWVAVDSGLHLGYAMENLLNTMEMAQEKALPEG